MSSSSPSEQMSQKIFSIRPNVFSPLPPFPNPSSPELLDLFSLSLNSSLYGMNINSSELGGGNYSKEEAVSVYGNKIK